MAWLSLAGVFFSGSAWLFASCAQDCMHGITVMENTYPGTLWI
jgi:hypothetical protein